MSPLEKFKAALAGTITVSTDGNSIDASKAEAAFCEHHPVSEELRRAGREYEAGALDLFAREAQRPMIDIMKGNKDIGFLTATIRDKGIELGISIARPEGDSVTREQYAAGISVHHRTELLPSTAGIAMEMAGLMME